MSDTRLIPLLLIDHDHRLIKTVRFGERTYIGDPFNVLRIFNEKEVDEICVLDIDAGADGRSPDFDFIRLLASECFMPLSYGGGITDLDHARRLIAGGIEKLVISSPSKMPLVRAIADIFGSQSLIGCVNYQGSAGDEAAADTLSPFDAATAFVEAGVGEIMLQSIDRDGMRDGMDVAGIGALSARLTTPVIALGGAGAATDMQAAIAAGADAAASGSAFCFIGPLRAVLVTYPPADGRPA